MRRWASRARTVSLTLTGNSAVTSWTWTRRTFYSGLDESRVHRLRRSGATFNRPRGRDFLSVSFERRIRILPLLAVGDLYSTPKYSPHPPSSPSQEEEIHPSQRTPEPSPSSLSLSRVLVVHPLSLDAVEAEVPFPAAHPSFYTAWNAIPNNESPFQLHTVREGNGTDDAHTFSRQLRSDNKRQLRQNGDTSLLRGFHTDSAGVRYDVTLCIDPFLDLARYRREEAQVEMISAYRNILYEAAELPGGVTDVLRVPALSCDTCGTRFQHEMGKLNQQSLIKGFHRLSHEAKEALILHRRFQVEIFVPPALLAQFQRAFLEDAWETPWSTMSPGRTALYPGLPPPRSLRQMEGWVGKRPELVEAMETNGESLLVGTPRALDGAPLEEQEVLTQIRVFGRAEEERARLERERGTAVEQGLEPAEKAEVAPLRQGIHQS